MRSGKFFPRAMHPLDRYSQQHFQRVAEELPKHILEVEMRIHTLSELQEAATAEGESGIAEECVIAIDNLEDKLAVFGALA